MQKLETKPGVVHQVVSGDTIVVAGPTIQSDDYIQGLRATKTLRLTGIVAPDYSTHFHHAFLSREFLRKWLYAISTPPTAGKNRKAIVDGDIPKDKINGKNSNTSSPAPGGAIGNDPISITFRERFVDEKMQHICDCTVNGIDLSLLMIQNGWAKTLQNDSTPRKKEDAEYYSRLRKAQQVATREKKGLWGLDGTNPPMVRINLSTQRCTNEFLTGARSLKEQKRLAWGVVDELLQDGTLKVIVPPTESDMRYLTVSPVRVLGLELPSSRTARFLLSEVLLNRDVQLAGDVKTPPHLVQHAELMKNLVKRGLLRLSDELDPNSRTTLAPLEKEAQVMKVGLWPVWEGRTILKPITVELRTGQKKVVDLPLSLIEHLESKLGPIGQDTCLNLSQMNGLDKQSIALIERTINSGGSAANIPNSNAAANPAAAKNVRAHGAANVVGAREPTGGRGNQRADDPVGTQGGWGRPAQSQRGPSDPRVKQLCNMGFSEQVARNALAECKWDVNLALDTLLSGDGAQEETPQAPQGAQETPNNEASGGIHIPEVVPTEVQVVQCKEEEEVIDNSPSVNNVKNDAATVETEVNDDDTTVSSPEGSVTENGEAPPRPNDLKMEYIQADRSPLAPADRSKGGAAAAPHKSDMMNVPIDSTRHDERTQKQHETTSTPHSNKTREHEGGVRLKIRTGFFPEPTDKKYLQISEGDEVDVHIENHSGSGWAYGRIGDTDGWFPTSCLGEIDLVTAKYEFTDAPEDSRPYLKLHLNTLCIVETRFDCGWWLGATLSKPDGHVGVKGYFPANFVQ